METTVKFQRRDDAVCELRREQQLDLPAQGPSFPLPAVRRAPQASLRQRALFEHHMAGRGELAGINREIRMKLSFLGKIQELRRAAESFEGAWGTAPASWRRRPGGWTRSGLPSPACASPCAGRRRRRRCRG